MPRSIFVALWARETEKKTLNHNIGTRMYYVEKAMQAAWDKYKGTKGDYAGLIHAIFLAPEYLFTNPREEDQATSQTRAVTEADKSYLVKTLTERSKKFPEMLIAPGTIIYALDEKKYPISFAKSRAKDVEQMEKLEKSMPVRPKEALWQDAEFGTASWVERFRAKWIPVRVKKTRQNKNLEPRSDSIGTEKALGVRKSHELGYGVCGRRLRNTG